MAPVLSTLSGRSPDADSFSQLIARVGTDVSTLAARALSAFNELLSDPSPLAPRTDIAPRSHIEPRSPYVHPKSMSAGVLVIFSLLGASIGLLVLWLFVMKGGFIWKPTDWEDYKSSVLRRPGGRPDDAITVFSDGSTRRAGGSTAGARTVVLGELDTTYTKSHVVRKFGPRPMKKKTTSVWGTGEGSIWGRLRGGGLNDNDTVVMREKEMRQVSNPHSFVDKQEPARPRGWKPEDSDLSGYPDLSHGGGTTVRHPPKVRHSKSRAAAAPPSRATRVKSTRGQKPAPQPRRIPTPEDDYTSSDSSSESESESDTDSDDESINQSQLGMAKGNKSYAHPLPMEKILAGRSQGPIERNGGGAGGTYGSGVPVGHLVPVGSRAVVHGGSREMIRGDKGYRKGSEGSLSSMDSIGSSRI